MRRIKPSKTRFTRRLRHDMTDAEHLLWRHLRLRQMDGFKFRRQYPIGKYIADFVCPEAGLAIEVDGGQHAEQVVSDRIRAEELEAQGLRVLRFWNHEVLQDIESVKVAIWNTLHDEASHSHPIPSPFQGEGGVDMDLWALF